MKFCINIVIEDFIINRKEEENFIIKFFFCEVSCLLRILIWFVSCFLDCFLLVLMVLIVVRMFCLICLSLFS